MTDLVDAQVINLDSICAQCCVSLVVVSNKRGNADCERKEPLVDETNQERDVHRDDMVHGAKNLLSLYVFGFSAPLLIGTSLPATMLARVCLLSTEVKHNWRPW